MFVPLSAGALNTNWRRCKLPMSRFLFIPERNIRKAHVVLQFGIVLLGLVFWQGQEARPFVACFGLVSTYDVHALA